MAGFVFVSFMMVALFAARFASYVTSSKATTVLLKVTLLWSWAPIRSSDALAFAIAFFMEASTASGVCSQSGIVSTAFAFVAAARKSSTVFRSAVSRFEEVAAINRTQRTDDFIWLEQGGIGHRYTQIFRDGRTNFDESLFHLCSSVATCI